MRAAEQDMGLVFGQVSAEGRFADLRRYMGRGYIGRGYIGRGYMGRRGCASGWRICCWLRAMDNVDNRRQPSLRFDGAWLAIDHIAHSPGGRPCQDRFEALSPDPAETNDFAAAKRI